MTLGVHQRWVRTVRFHGRTATEYGWKCGLALLVAAAILSGCGHTRPPTTASDQVVARSFQEHKSGVQVTGVGVVTRILSDDTEGGRHQRFILSLSSGQTLLIAHNIDIAPRVDSLGVGDSVEFNGVYEWNSEGGVVHWTHHDPSGQHQLGWLKHKGNLYQ